MITELVSISGLLKLCRSTSLDIFIVTYLHVHNIRHVANECNQCHSKWMKMSDSILI
jgi:hypothetical protein